MSETFWSRVGQAYGLLRLYDRLRRECRPPRPRAKGIRFGLWVSIPVLAGVLPAHVAAGLLALGLACYLVVFPPLRLNTFEALRLPARRAQFAARLLRALPWLLWLGASAVVALGRWAAGLRDDFRLTPAFALTVVQLPWLALSAFGVLGI